MPAGIGCAGQSKLQEVVKGDRARPAPPFISSINLDEIFAAADGILKEEFPSNPGLQEELDKLARVINASRLATSAFKKLCAAGCDREELLRKLAAGSGNPESFNIDELTAMDARKRVAFSDRLQRSAAEIQTLNFRGIATICKASGLGESLQLPRRLTEYRMLLSFMSRLRPLLYRAAAKRHLIRYVQERTGHFYDKDVAELLATITGADYAETAHSQWRYNNVPGDPTFSVRSTPKEIAEAITKAVFSMWESDLLLKFSRKGLNWRSPKS